MSQYNKTVLTRAGLELAKKANAGQAKFGITRAVTSADDWSGKTTQDLEDVTAIPNIMQQGTIMDAEEVESNNSVIGVSLKFTNKDLINGYQIRIIGLYVKEEGQKNDFLYAVTTAITPEYMPNFADKVLYRFNMQMYLVIGKAQAVNVVIDEGTAVTHSQFDKYKGEVADNLKKLENTHKEDMSHAAKSASINGGAEILPDSTGKLNLVVPDPDLSKYVSLEQLTETLKSKADITAIPDKTATEEGIKQAKELAQEADTKAQSALDNKADKTTVEGDLATKANQSDLDQTNAEVAKKANSADVYTKADIPLAFKGTLTSTDDMNKVWESGIYITEGAAPKNFPPSDINHGFWGTTLVYNHDAGQILQLWLVQGNVFHRWITNSAPQTEWQRYADQSDITDLQNQIQQLKDNQFEVQTFTDATAAASWEAQKPGKRMAIVNS